MKASRKFSVLGSTVALIGVLFLLASAGCGDKTTSPPANRNPTVQSVNVNPSTVNAGGLATVTVTANDPDGDALTYAYTPNGGAVSGSGSQVTWTAPGNAGAYSVSVQVSDGKGGSATGSGNLTVNPAVTQIVGTAGLPAGSAGDLSNAKVSIYTSLDTWNLNQPVKFGAVTGAGATVSFTLADNIVPGNYYLDVWKDIDNSATWSVGDFVGWYGTGGLGSPTLTQFSINSGQTVNTGKINMYLLVAETAGKGLKKVTP